MLVGLARSPRSRSSSRCRSSSARRRRRSSRPSEAMQWLNAHHVHSPITRHALVVLESIDAVDLAFDTFVCALLDGEVDTSGYPEYNAIVGGVAAHWDEATGDMICRAVVGWGGKGVRGDTDRIGAKLLGGPAQQHPGQPVRARPDEHRAAGAGRRPRRPRVRPLRLRVGPRAGVLLPEVRHAPAARLTAARHAALRLRLRGLRPAVRGRPRRPRRPGPTHLPDLRQGPDPQGDHRAGRPLQGHRAGPRRTAARPRRPARRRRRASGDGGDRPSERRDDGTSGGIHEAGDGAARRTPAPASRVDQAGRGRRHDARRTEPMAAATDWITLAEAAEILAAANIHFTLGHDRRLGASRPAPEHQARWPAVRPARRGPGARRGAAARPRRGPPARSCSTTWGAEPGRRMDPRAILARILEQPLVVVRPGRPRHLRSGRRRPAGQRPGVLGAVRR